MKKILIVIVLYFFIPVTQASADVTSFGTVTSLPINGSNIPDGAIISSSKQGYILSQTAYDPLMLGIVSLHPAVSIEDVNNSTSKPVLSYGKAYVRVSTINGPIREGDMITSSTIPGVGEKAGDVGYVIGTADNDYTNSNTHQVGEILVTVYPHFNQGSSNLGSSLLNGLRFAFSSAFLTPLGTLRYFIAGFIVLVSFLIGFNFFGKTSSRGIEAIGRNPLAGNKILLSVFMNVSLTILIMAFGVAIGYLILVL